MDEKKVREAIELIKIQIHVLEEFVNYGGIIEEKKKKHIRLHKTAIEALEKQLPEKVDTKEDFKGFNGNLICYKGFCPSCGYVVDSSKTNYCNACGQKLDWTVEE